MEDIEFYEEDSYDSSDNDGYVMFNDKVQTSTEVQSFTKMQKFDEVNPCTELIVNGSELLKSGESQGKKCCFKHSLWIFGDVSVFKNFMGRNDEDLHEYEETKDEILSYGLFLPNYSDGCKDNSRVCL
ncbi:hypothetical protein L6452_25438 [Arctium lappa]|uniref:Uncharacterized protein n=1 Tax=Arctium lappa TaxID=4217 RepID=A0ACB9AB01_ARCLA|nr:hypothetical protein L6452_25438 [Arctium lappa]